MSQNLLSSIPSTDIDLLKRILSDIHAAARKDGNQYGFSIDLPSFDHNLLLLPKQTMEYAKSSKRHQRRKNTRLRSIVEVFKMTNREAILALATPVEIQSFFRMESLPTAAAVSLLMTRRFTERDLTFLRDYFLHIPNIKKIRSERWANLKSLPPLHILQKESPVWKLLEQGRVYFNSKEGRSILAARYKIDEYLSSRIQMLSDIENGLDFLDLNCIPSDKRRNTIPLLFSLDSGTGTVKLMCKILRKNTSQKTEDIMFISQYCGSDESFTALEKYFSESAREIRALARNGIIINSIKYEIYPIYVADYKVYYSMTGTFGPNAAFPCPFCLVQRKDMDCTQSELLEKYKVSDLKYLEVRPEMKDLGDADKDDGKLQRKGTYNIFGMQRGINMNFIPPPLHKRLGLINKVIAVLHEVQLVWERKLYWTEMESNMSPIRNHLYKALLATGVKREKYHAGELTGVGCTTFMRKIDVFISEFFGKSIPDYGMLSDVIPNTENLKHGLVRLSAVYIGTKEKKGLNYYLSTPSKWDSTMLTNFESCGKEFLFELRRTFWRRREKRAEVANSEEPWRKPFLMVKLHCLIVHVTEVVKKYGYYAVFSEEGFELLQQSSKRIRKNHSPNKSLGAQIVDDLQYSGVSSSPKVINLRRSAEQHCIDNGRPIKKPRFMN